jgi:hypothetical protein
MNKTLLLVLLLTACSSQEDRIIARQKEIHKETIRLMLEYKRKHPTVDSFGERPINRDELLSFSNKISSLKEEKDSLQNALEKIRDKRSK